MKYKYLILDWDGTIVDTYDMWMDLWARVFRDAGAEFTYEELIFEIEKDWQMAPAAFGIDNPREFINKAVEDNIHIIGNPSIYEDTRFIFDNVDLPRSIVTSASKFILDTAINNLNIKNDFDICITKDDVIYPKPNPEGINIVVEKFQLDKSEVLMIGDTNSDINAARNAQVDSFFINRKPERYDAFKLLEMNPTYHSESMRDLLDIL